MSKKRSIRIGLLGFGVVGQGVWKNIEKNRLALEYRLGTQLEITQVVVKDASKAVSYTHLTLPTTGAV